MATGLASAFVIYENEFNAGRIEMEAQNADAFNAASNGTIIQRSAVLKGNYAKEAFFTNTSGLVQRRDTTSVAAATPVSLAQGETISAKLKRFMLSEQTLDSFKSIASDPSELSFIVGQQFAKAEMLEKLNLGLKGLVAGIGNVGATAALDGTGGTIDHTKLASLLALFGDRAQDIKAFVMHSKVVFDLLKQSIADKIVNVADQAIVQASVFTLNRPIIISDSASLISGSTYYTLGLTQGAIDIVDSEERSLLSETVGGLKNLVGRIQAEYAYNLGYKGYKYLVASGANPDDTAVGTGTNWVKVANSIKDTAGVRLATL